jgi:hypothetical protein
MQLLKITYADRDLIETTTFKIQNIKMYKDFDGYATKFRSLASKLRNDSATLCMWFRSGLPYNIRQHLKTKKKNSLTDYIHKARMIHMSNLADRMQMSSDMGNNKLTSNEADKNKKVTTHNNSTPFLQRREFDRRRHENLCFKCGSGEHNALKCPMNNTPKVNILNEADVCSNASRHGPISING